MEFAIFTIGLTLGVATLATVMYRFVRKGTFGLPGSLLSMIGTVLIAMTIWSISESRSPTAVDQRLVEVERTLSATSKRLDEAERSAGNSRDAFEALVDLFEAAPSQGIVEFDSVRAILNSEAAHPIPLPRPPEIENPDLEYELLP